MHEYSLTLEAETLVCTELQKAFPNALGIYAFGSRVQGTANAQSDLDLAVLVAGYAEPLQLFEMANQLADKLGYEVDLLDLRAASTVMQYQVITTGRRLWAKDVQTGLFEAFVLSAKTSLDEARAELLNEIREDGTIYGDDVLINKATTIERCISRVREEYAKAGTNFATDYSRQDAAIFNIQRACEAALDVGQHLIRDQRLGVPQSSRDVFTLLAQAKWIDLNTAETMKRMVGFRNIAVHDYQALLLPIVENIITNNLDDFINFSKQLLQHK
ncbi:MAG: toxin-antitoxin antitoxin component [Cellvibrio sp.]|jgi:uncharacterized protein YutE (UPF0331/DUF86 family)/predicted nucleotidyltransferase|nr:toxin-antitoxin antitoxin component [Cellvibrio sp.]